MRSPRIGIVGAGPAGLTAALAARKLGLETTLFEQASDFKPIGGGVALQDNGLRVLEALGLLESFRSIMRPCPLAALELAGGKPLVRADMRRVSFLRHLPAIVLRYELQEYLLASALRQGVQVLFNHRCTGVSREGPGAILRFANGSEYECSIVIAADGVHSQLRESMDLPATKKAIGKAYVRGVAELRVEESKIREIWAPDGRLFGIAPLPGDRAYFYCSVPLGRWQDILQGHLEEWIEGWDGLGRDVASLLKAVPDWERVNYDELHETRLERWYRGPVFVVGDAAHAMTPYLGQGANCAMVDSLVVMQLLARAVRKGEDLEGVGRTYESLRRSFVSRIQTRSRRQGVVATVSFAPARFLRNLVLPLTLKVSWLSRSGMRLATGYHPKEEPYFQFATG